MNGSLALLSSGRRPSPSAPVGRAIATVLVLLAATSGSARADIQPQPAKTGSSEKTTVASAVRRKPPWRPGFLNHDDDAVLAALCHQPPVTVSSNPLGTTVKFKATLLGGMRVGIRPSQVNSQGYHRADVASYHLSRALGLNTIAPSCLVTLERADLETAERLTRTMRGRIATELRPTSGKTIEASVTLWVDDLRHSKLDLDVAEWRPLLRQTSRLDGIPRATLAEAIEGSRLITWDFLIDNWDRWSGGNTFRTGSGNTPVWLDNAAGFGSYTRAMRRKNQAQLRGVERFSRRFISALRSTDGKALIAALAPAALSPRERNDLIERRLFLLDHVDQLVAIHGELAVLVFD